MTDPVRAAAIACGLLAAAELALLILLFGDSSSEAVLAAAISSAALACLLLSVREAGRLDFGSAIAWAYTSLGIVLLLFLFELPQVHISRLFGGQQCDPMVGDCMPDTPQYWVPLILTVASCIATLRFIRRCKRELAAEGAESG